MRVARVLAIWLMGCSLLSVAEAAGVHVPNYERVVLPNGATLLLMERHNVPLVGFHALLRGGAAVDEAQKAGATGILADLLTKGAGKRDALQFAEAIEAAGGEIQAEAGLEALNVSGRFLSRDQALMVELLADLLQRPHLDQKEFENLRNRQIEFIRAAKDSSLDSLLPIYANAALFGAHPYGKAVNGSEASLPALTYEDIRRTYEQQIGADRLILAVTGDFSSAKMKNLLRSAFGSWRRAPAALPKLATPTPVKGRRVLLVDAPASVQTYFWIGNVGVARGFPERVPLDVANTLFGGKFTSMLNSELRIRSGLTYGASSRFRRLSQPGPWAMSSFTRTDSTGQAVDLALQVFARLHQGEFDANALSSSKNFVLGQFPTRYETATQWASTLAELEFYGLPREEVESYADKVAAVKQDDAHKAVETAFPGEQDLLFVFIGNAAKIRAVVGQYGPVTEMKLSDPSFAH